MFAVYIFTNLHLNSFTSNTFFAILETPSKLNLKAYFMYQYFTLYQFVKNKQLFNFNIYNTNGLFVFAQVLCILSDSPKLLNRL